MADPALHRNPALAAPSGIIARLPTGAKIFLILSAALLPLAVIAFFASLKTTQSVDDEASAMLRIATSEIAQKLTNELVGDMTALRAALTALDADPDNAPSCARAQGVFGQRGGGSAIFVILDRTGRPVCGSPFPGSEGLAANPYGAPVATRIIAGRGIVMAIAGPNGMTRATAFFPTAFLAAIGRPGGFMLPFEARLLHRDGMLGLMGLPVRDPLERRRTLTMPLGIGELALQMTMRSPPITSPMLIAMLLPILMWAAAAGIGWFVVDRLLIRPLRQLRSSVAAFTPGEEIDPAEVRALPAQEIRELGDTFRAISRTVTEHEAGLAAGLVRQTKLTREVHHRVKNNLQVISSLINFHARGARSAEASAAYASIQRRVDALAVVHRNHFAEMEENRGLSLRAVIGELASNIRATASEDSSRLGITLEIDPYLANQDVAIAIAFLITEIVELAMGSGPVTQLRISVKPAEKSDDRAVLRVSSPSLVESDTLRGNIAERYGRVIEGLSRQLRSRLHHDPLVGAYEIVVATTGRD